LTKIVDLLLFDFVDVRFQSVNDIFRRIVRDMFVLIKVRKEKEIVV